MRSRDLSQAARLRRFVISLGAWTWTAILLSAAVCAAISWMHFHHRDSTRQVVEILENVRKARIDLARGFLHLTLADGSGEPFDRAQGIALLDRSIRSLQTTIATAERLGVIRSDEAWIEPGFESSVRTFRNRVAAWSNDEKNATSLTRLRSAFSELERHADQVDDITRRNLDVLNNRLQKQFERALLAAALFLGVLCTGVFVTTRAQKRSAAVLQQREDLLRAMSSMAHVGGWEFDPETGAGEWTEEVARIHDLDPRAPATADVGLSVYSGEHRARIESSIREAVEHAVSYDLELEMVTVTGARKWVRTIGVPIVEDGRVVRLCGSIQDITDRKRTQQALIESDDRFRQLTESIREVFWLLDIDTRALLYVSPAFESIFGRPVEAVLRNPAVLVDAIHAEDRNRLDGMMNVNGHDGREDELRIVRPDGSIRWIRVRIFAVHDRDGQIHRLAGIADDVTERKQLEEQFLQSQRVEALGRLAGGLAHDLNNILMPILTGAEVLKRTVDTPKAQQMIGIIQTSVRRGSDVIRQLLAFARGGEGVRAIVQPRHLIAELVRLMRATLPSDIRISDQAPRDLWNLYADATQIHQILMNLCVNARDAMPSGGQLSLTAANVRLEAKDVEQYPGVRPGDFVRIDVSDTGEGIPHEVLGRVFDPFFTTKAVGKGTGLGLSVVLGIVRAHGGFIRVRSEAGSGSTFEVYLPAAGAGSAQTPPEEDALEPNAVGESILIVDDEEPIRLSLSGLLEHRGFRVLIAASGREAITLALRTGVRLVITDIRMPGMDGITLARTLRAFDPAIRVIGVSGSLQSLDDLPIDSRTLFRELLAKPVDHDTLFAAISRQLTPASR